MPDREAGPPTSADGLPAVVRYAGRVVAPHALHVCPRSSAGITFLATLLNRLPSPDLVIGRTLNSPGTPAGGPILARLTDPPDRGRNRSLLRDPTESDAAAGGGASLAGWRRAGRRCAAPRRCRAGPSAPDRRRDLRGQPLSADPHRDHAAVIKERRRRALAGVVDLRRLNNRAARDLAVIYTAAPYVDTPANVAARRVLARGRVVDVVSNDMSGRLAIDPSSDIIWVAIVDRRLELDARPADISWPGVSEFCHKGMAQITALEWSKGLPKRLQLRDASYLALPGSVAQTPAARADLARRVLGPHASHRAGRGAAEQRAAGSGSRTT